MSNELREAINICIECFLFAILILIVSFFGDVARDSLDLKVQQNNTMVELQEMRSLYEYTEGKFVEYSYLKGITSGLNYPGYTWSFFESNIKPKNLHTVIKGDDVVKFVGTFPKEYDVYIIDNNGGKRLYSPHNTDAKLNGLRKGDDFEEWITSNLSSWMGSSIMEEFCCFAVYNSDVYEYDAVVFIQKMD